MQTSRTAQQLCDFEGVKPQPPPFLLLGLEPVQSCLGVARVEVVASLPQGRTAAAQCGLFTQKSVPVIFEPPCIF